MEQSDIIRLNQIKTDNMTPDKFDHQAPQKTQLVEKSDNVQQVPAAALHKTTLHSTFGREEAEHLHTGQL